MVSVSGFRPAAVASFRTSSRPVRNSSGDKPVGCQPSPRVAARLRAPGLEPPTHSGMVGLLRWLRSELEAGQVPSWALVVGIGTGPELLHDLHGLVRERPALSKGDTQRVELLPHGAHPDAQDQPPTGDLIQRRGVLGQLHGVVVRQYHDRGPEPHSAGGGGQIRQGGQRMVVRLVVEPLSDVAAVQQMVHDPDGVVAQRFGQWPHGQYLRAAPRYPSYSEWSRRCACTKSPSPKAYAHGPWRTHGTSTRSKRGAVAMLDKCISTGRQETQFRK